MYSENDMQRNRRVLIIDSLLVLVLFSYVAMSTASTVGLESGAVPTGPSVQYMAYGHGRLTCRHFLVARHEATRGGYLELNYFRQWFAGFMSGYNLYKLNGSSAIASAGDEAKIEEMLGDYCADNREKTFASASAAVIGKLRDKK